MMALQHRCVIVQDGQLTSSIAEERVCSPWMIHVMNSGSNESSNLINWIQALLKKRKEINNSAIWHICENAANRFTLP